MAGLDLQQVSVSGHRFTPDGDIFDAVDLAHAPTMLSFDVRAAKQRIERLPWVERASIERIIPDRLEVRIVERAAFAVWQAEGRTFLIDKSGRVLTAIAADAMPVLPRVAGDGAPAEAAALFSLLARHPDLLAQVKLAERVGGRRWTLRLADGGSIALPASGERQALARAVALGKAGIARMSDLDLRVEGRALSRKPRGAQDRNERAADAQDAPGRSSRPVWSGDVGAGRKRRRQAQDVLGVLDVGTSKTVCVIAMLPGSSAAASSLAGVQVLGIGEQPTRGLAAGAVTDIDAAEQVVRGAVMQAERMAGLVLEEIYLGVASRGLKSSTFAASANVEERVVGENDIDRLLDAGRRYAERDERTLLHMNCISYRLDETGGIADPRGMAGAKLAADLHAVTVKDAPLQNLLHVVERAHLPATGLAPAPLAAGLAATTREERQLGVVTIDMGAGTTSVAMFAQGHALWTDLVPGGGGNITGDIARALAISGPEAETIKRECDMLAGSAGEDDEASPKGRTAGLRLSHRATMSEVRDIVRSRVAVHLRHVAQRIKASGVAHLAGDRVVLAGGASLQPGMRELAAEIFVRPVRLARLDPLPGMPGQFCHPQYAAAIGLVHLALDPTAGVRRGRPGARPSGYLGRVGQWLSESF